MIYSKNRNSNFGCACIIPFALGIFVISGMVLGHFVGKKYGDFGNFIFAFIFGFTFFMIFIGTPPLLYKIFDKKECHSCNKKDFPKKSTHSDYFSQ